MKIRVTLCNIIPEVGVHDFKMLLRFFSSQKIIDHLSGLSDGNMFDHGFY